MRLPDISFANLTASGEGSALHGTRRLLRDLVAAGLMLDDRPTAFERLQATLGREFASVVFASLTGTPGPDISHVRPRRAA